MFMTLLHAAQDTPDKGTLQVNVISSENNFPVENATVSIANTDTPDQVIEELTTNSSGQTAAGGTSRSTAGIQPAGG